MSYWKYQLVGNSKMGYWDFYIVEGSDGSQDRRAVLHYCESTRIPTIRAIKLSDTHYDRINPGYEITKLEITSSQFETLWLLAKPSTLTLP